MADAARAIEADGVGGNGSDSWPTAGVARRAPVMTGARSEIFMWNLCKGLGDGTNLRGEADEARPHGRVGVLGQFPKSVRLNAGGLGWSFRESR